MISTTKRLPGLSAFLLLCVVAAALIFWLLPPSPSPGPDDGPTMVADGVLRAGRPLLGDCNDNGVVDISEVAHKPLGLGAPAAFTTADGPAVYVPGDFNGDNTIDLAIAHEGVDSVLVLFNDGAGAFPPADRVTLTLDSSARDIAAGDFNNDGLLDLAVARAGDTSEHITVFQNDSGAPGTFSPTAEYAVGDTASIWTIQDIAAVDLDGENGSDLAVIAQRVAIGSQSDLHILLSEPGGSLDTTSYLDLWLAGAASVIAADLDQDGDQDLAIGGGDWIILARNEGGGGLRVPPDGAGDFDNPLSDYYGLGYEVAGGRELASVDLNRDGYPELLSLDRPAGTVLIVPNISDGETPLFDNAPESLRSLAAPGASSLSVADLDGDGFPDLAVDGPDLEQAAIFLSQGDLRFEPTAYEFDAGVQVSRVLAVELDGVSPAELTALSTEGDRLVVFANASRISPDCNTNGIPDACDVASATSNDCNLNRVPDECELAYHVGFSSRAVWKHYAYNSDWDVDDFEIVEGPVPLLGWSFYDPILWSADLDNDSDNDVMVMNSWTAEYLRFLFNLDYGDFVFIQNPGEFTGGSSTRLRNFLYLDLGVGFSNERAIAMASGEFTGDSMTDLAVVTLEPARVDGRDVTVTALKVVQQGRSDGTTTWETRDVIYEQTNPRLPPMRHVVAADFDLDGHEDIAVTPDVISSDLGHDPDLEVEFKIVLLRNDGAGGFIHDPDIDIQLDGAVTSIDVEDLSGDGRPEIIVSKHSAPQVTVCHNNSTVEDGFDFTGGCRDFAAGSIPLAARAGDLDGDDFPEIVVANAYTSHVSVLHNSPIPGADPEADAWRENFDAPEEVSVRGTAPSADPRDLDLVDVDLDGDLDIVTGNSQSNSVTVMRNAGDGTFLAAMVFAVGYGPEALHVGNLNRDARPDIAVAHGDGSVTILLNRSRVPSSTDATGDGLPDECGED